MTAGRRAVVLCSTHHQLVMGQAVLSLVGADYSEAVIVWFGQDELARLRALQVDLGDHVRHVECRTEGRLERRVWREGRGILPPILRAARAAIGPAGVPTDVFAGADNALFVRLVMELYQVPWNRVVLYEEGLGVYVGSAQWVQKTATNLLLAARGTRHRLFLRDFSRNPRIRRVACNHPYLISRADLQVIDTAAAYRTVLSRIAAKIRAGGPAPRRPIECLYLSGSFSEARHMSLRSELAMLDDLRRAIIEQLAPTRLYVKFHHFDSPAKRDRIRQLGFDEVEIEHPIEIDCLLRPYGHLVSFRSSAMLNLPLLQLGDTRLWLARDLDRQARRLYRPAIARVFDAMVARYRDLAYFGATGPRPAGALHPAGVTVS